MKKNGGVTGNSPYNICVAPMIHACLATATTYVMTGTAGRVGRSVGGANRWECSGGRSYGRVTSVVEAISYGEMCRHLCCYGDV